MTVNESTILETKATGEEIEAVIAAIEPSLVNRPTHHVLIACLSLAILIMHPDISPEKLQAAVKGTSQYICMLLSGVDESNRVPKEQLN